MTLLRARRSLPPAASCSESDVSSGGIGLDDRGVGRYCNSALSEGAGVVAGVVKNVREVAMEEVVIVDVAEVGGSAASGVLRRSRSVEFQSISL